LVDKISNITFMPFDQSSDGPRQPNNKDIVIYKGMTVDQVLQSGSDSQKLFARNFDFITHKFSGDNDLVYNRYEADTFNNFKFELSENQDELVITNKSTNGKVVFKFNNIEDIENLEPQFMSAGYFIQFLRDTAKSYENVEFDLRNNTVTISNQITDYTTSMDLGVLRNFDKITLNNCGRMFSVNANGFEGELVLYNVHDKLFGSDRRTLVHEGSAKVTSNLEYKTR